MEFKDYELKDQVLIGPYIYIVRGKDGEYWLGKEEGGNGIIFKYLKVEKSSYVKNILGYKSSGDFPETRTLEDLNKVIRQLQIDCLLKEAKEKYPLGTIFKSIFNKLNYKSSGKFEWIPENKILRDVEVYGVIKHENNWAEIITEEPKQPEINTYGLKVGDALTKDIIIAWVKHGENRQQKSEKDGKWHKANGTFIDNRTIESFKNIDGVVGFLVSGTSEVYLRAEGFKEFVESFDKPKFEVGKWYKSNVASNNGNKFYYLKVLGVNKGHPYGQAINILDNKNYVYNKEHKWTYQKTIEQALSLGPLTDLSEIQNMLPNKHPDKIKAQPEYIVGKWYRLGALIGKFRKLDEDRFCVFKSGTPSDNYKFPDGGHLSIKCQGTPVLITDMTEVYRLFPEEKPDDSKFEVNDWVVVESWYYAKIPLPQTCQISKIDSEDETLYEILLNEDHYRKNKSWYFKKGEFRHATSEEVDREIERRQIIKGGSPRIAQIIKGGSLRIAQIVKSVVGEEEKYPFKPLKKSDLEWEIISPKINMLLSIDDEELPMVNIIKVKTIKQLLNND